MTVHFKRLNESGVAAFTDYVRGGADGPPPFHLLEDVATSEPLEIRIEPGTALFDDRYMFGVYLRTLLRESDPALINGDKGLWSALALLWFDRICPLDAQGKRSVKEDYYYVLSPDYRHYYRHLVRSPWQFGQGSWRGSSIPFDISAKAFPPS